MTGYFLIYTNEIHIYVNITVYLPHSSYMFQCVIHHLQGGILVFLHKTTRFLQCCHVEISFIECKMYTTFCSLHCFTMIEKYIIIYFAYLKTLNV